MFERVKRYYELGLYTEVHVMAFVTKGYLTMEQYNEIVNPQSEVDETPDDQSEVTS